ncbi:MAG: hypothetical protein HY222_06265 [Thaumarchaeota archaeon]|nr:hypothetical protein [Nitrososphaerota archaeon]MBI3641980.1 hypothetical protein [Nitrososphaerota archaeon]
MKNSFLDTFQQFRTILCLCPECDHLSRLSDLHLRYKGKAPKTWLDDYEFTEQKMEKQESKFEEEEESIREKARERGRAKVPVIVRKSMDQQFAKLKYDPYDIKPLLHPVDFVIFDGMNKDLMNKIVLLSRNSANSYLQGLQKSVASAVREKRYDWKVARVSMDGKIEFE